VRFAVAKQHGLDEAQVDQIDDQHATSALAERTKLALAWADAFLGADGPPPPEVAERVHAEFTDAELREMGAGLALFHGFSKLLIALGCEPEEMDVTELRTPGTRAS
jgi:alkylhydroperoxidase family enzyme